MTLFPILLLGGMLVASPVDSLQTATDLNAPLVQALRERRHEDAERIARRQLDLRRRFGESRDLSLATSLTYLSLAARNLGDVQVAVSSARETLEIMLELYGRESSNSATALNNLAGALRLKGDLAGAEALYREALQLQTQQFGEDAPRLSGPHNNLGALLGQLGDSVGSEEHLRRATELARQHYGEEHSNVALALVNLANALRRQDRPAAALVELDRAESLYQSLGDSTGWAAARRTRVRTLMDLGELRRATETAQELREFQEWIVPPNRLDLARIDALLGHAQLAEGRNAHAKDALGRAYASLAERLGDSHPETVNVATDLAESMLELADPAAVVLLENVAELYEDARSRVSVSRSRATVDLRSPYELLARARLASGDELAAWQAAERQQARVLMELLDLSAGELPSELARSRTALLGQLTDLEQETLRFDEKTTVDPELRTERRAELLRAQAEWSRLQTEIVALHPRRHELPSLAQLAVALPKQGALVGWIRGAAYCIRSDGTLQWVETSDAGDGSERELLQRALRAPAESAAFVQPTVDEAMRGHMGSLYLRYFEALEPLLDDVDQLFMIPGSGLRGIPMDVLESERGELLGERFELHLLPSASFLSRPQLGGGQVESALFVGDPPFQGSNSQRFSRLAPLAKSASEVLRCAPKFRSSARYLGMDATEKAIRSLIVSGEMERFDVVHIATHALADPLQPGRSTLVLSQADLEDPVETILSGEPVLDGAISAAEIARNWKLDAQLVTLSACESGLGRHAEGEGYLGFAHSLFEAGAHRVLVSLWSVDDEATALLMERFYSHWISDEMSPGRALQEAKRWLRETEGGRFEHPYFWAAFVLLGA